MSQVSNISQEKFTSLSFTSDDQYIVLGSELGVQIFSFETGHLYKIIENERIGMFRVLLVCNV